MRPMVCRARSNLSSAGVRTSRCSASVLYVPPGLTPSLKESSPLPFLREKHSPTPKSIAARNPPYLPSKRKPLTSEGVSLSVLRC
jgi:hypothetical protein